MNYRPLLEEEVPAFLLCYRAKFFLNPLLHDRQTGHCPTPQVTAQFARGCRQNLLHLCLLGRTLGCILHSFSLELAALPGARQFKNSPNKNLPKRIRTSPLLTHFAIASHALESDTNHSSGGVPRPQQG